jgi:hemerythrin-like metal-binding protein
VQHFADEEAPMTAAGFPAAAPHRSLHQHLTSETMTIAARYFNGEDVRPEMLAPFVVRWLTEHIASADKEFVRFLSGAQ